CSDSLARTFDAWHGRRGGALACYNLESVNAPTDKYNVSEIAKKGEDAQGARARLAKHVLLHLGAGDEEAAAGAAEASADPRFLDDIVEGLVDDGSFALARLPDRRATEADLEPSLLGPAFQ